MSYDKIYEFLEALPPEDRRFARGRYYSATDKCACVIGALFPEFAKLPLSQTTRILTILHELNPPNYTGATEYELDRLQQINDDNEEVSPEMRYAAVMKWLKGQIT